jgi:uncharacterized oxidoreductase
MSAHPRVLITGGSVGLGLAMAREFLARGAEVLVCARSEADLARAARETPGLQTLVADVSRDEDRRRLMTAATAGGAIDILVNNAAICRAHDYANPFTLALDRASDEIQINLAAPIELIRLYLDDRLRTERGATPGTIVNVGTPGALFPLEANPLYSTTKAGLHMFTLALRRHLREGPVRVIEVFPPALDTRLADALDVPSQAAHGKAVIKAVAAEIVDGVERGDAVILPHKQSRQLYASVQHLDDAFVDRINAGVKRRAGWDQG